MSRRQREQQQTIPSLRNSTTKIVAPPPPSIGVPVVGLTIPAPMITVNNNNNINNSNFNSNNNGTNFLQTTMNQNRNHIQNLLKLQPSAYDFQHFDLASLGDAELCAFFSQAIDTIDSPVFLPSQPTHSRLISSLVRCLGTMPWGRIFSVATVPANLAVESSKALGVGVGGGKDGAANSAKPATSGSFLFKLPSYNRARAYPTNNMHDLHAFAKTTRRQVSTLFALLAIKLGNFSPSSIPDIISAAVQYFNHLPPAAEVSMNLWYSLPPTLSMSEGSAATASSSSASSASAAPAPAATATTATTAAPNHQHHPHHHHQHQQHHHHYHHHHENVPSSSAPSSCRAYASALTTWLDNEIDTHIFRVFGSLLARYDEYQSHGSISRTTLAVHNRGDDHHHQQQHQYVGPLKICMTVLENSIPKKRWPVMAHHLTWFSVMGKFFQSREVEAMTKSLGELEFAQNTKYAANPSSLLLSTTTTTVTATNTSATNPLPSSSNSDNNSSNMMINQQQQQQQQQQFSSPSPRPSFAGRSSISNSNNQTNPTYSTSGSPSAIQYRAQSCLSEGSFSQRILRFMLTALSNLETLARLSRENSYGARRCAAIVVDSMMSVAFLQQKQMSEKTENLNNDSNNNTVSITISINSNKQQQLQQQQSGAAAAKSQHQIFPPQQQVSSPFQGGSAVGGGVSSAANVGRNSYFSGRPSSLFSFAPDVELLFPVILHHYLENVIVSSNQSVCCTHAVVIAVAVGVDYVLIESPVDVDGATSDFCGDSEVEGKQLNDDSNSNPRESYSPSCVQALAFSSINRLGKAFLNCVSLDLFVQESKSAMVSSSSPSSHFGFHESSDSVGQNSSLRAMSFASSSSSSTSHSGAGDVHSELLAVSHLAACLKSLINLAVQSPQFVKEEIFERKSFHSKCKRGNNVRIAKSLTDLLHLLVRNMNNNHNNNNNDTNNCCANRSAAHWLIEEVVKPFCQMFGFSSVILSVFGTPKSPAVKKANDNYHTRNNNNNNNNNNRNIGGAESKKQLVPKSPFGKLAHETVAACSKQDDEEESSKSRSTSSSKDSLSDSGDDQPRADDDDEDAEAAINRFFSNRNKLDLQKTQQQQQVQEENAASFEVIRAPEVSKKIWRSYASFMKELLPFTI